MFPQCKEKHSALLRPSLLYTLFSLINLLCRLLAPSLLIQISLEEGRQKRLMVQDKAFHVVEGSILSLGCGPDI